MFFGIIVSFFHLVKVYLKLRPVSLVQRSVIKWKTWPMSKLDSLTALFYCNEKGPVVGHQWRNIVLLII